MSLIINQREKLIDTELLNQAKTFLAAGQLICFPTDTVYALAARADHAGAVDRIYQLKGRDPQKPLALLAGSIEQARRIAQFDTRAERLAARFFPGALTLVLALKKDSPIAANVNAGLGTIGIRIPNHPLALALLNHLDMPLVATSVNLSGQASALAAEEIPEIFHEHIGMIIDGGPAMLGVSSTVVDLSGEEMVILRQGTVTEAEVRGG